MSVIESDEREACHQAWRMCVTTSMLALDDTPPACPKLKKFFRTARNLLAPVLELPAFTNGGDLKVQLRGIMKSSFQNEMEAQTHVFCTVDEGLSALWTELTVRHTALCTARHCSLALLLNRS